ncbi:MAG: NlpC/P60 family protein [Gammaproteobacteria bacterium]|nr:NlpC/P60 family protein [Gammaproteobacteria bacterium]
MKTNRPTMLVWVLGALFLLLSGCGSAPEKAQSQQEQSARVVTSLHLLEHHQAWQGVPYQLGGMSRQGVDCSGFVYLTYRDLFGVVLPRTTLEQSKVGPKASRGALAPGDLVFFRTGRRLRHVGIVIDQQRFLHASTRRGVMISNLDDRYWSARFWKATRPLVSH